MVDALNGVGLVPRLVADAVRIEVSGRTLVEDVSLSLAAGELVAIVGGSGAGKTTLLRSLAGVRRPTSGSVTFGGADVTGSGTRRHVGSVPQDDIIHLDLPLRRTLLHAARLRLPADATSLDVEAAVERVLEELDLAHRADVRVRDLSGGQRKRASIAVELLARPEVLLLDEPTSGLDPATAAEVLRVLRGLARRGTTVVLTTHAPADVHRCDRVVVLAQGGRVAFDGTPQETTEWFGVQHCEEVYEAIEQMGHDRAVARFMAHASLVTGPGGDVVAQVPRGPAPVGPLRQLLTLARRSIEIMAHNRLTAAILLGSPVLVIAMMAVLFQPHTFDATAGDPVAAVQLVYWIAFAGFFFGLTYGLLQIVTETPILRREQSWGLSTASYVGSKIVVLLPLLAAVGAGLLVTLRVTDRLPALPVEAWAELGAVFILDAGAGLALGLVASAIVSNAAQATLALPMLCFPQVLFAGAMVPLDAMTAPGRTISAVMSNRWAFEAIGRVLDVPGRFPGDPSPLSGWTPAFSGAPGAPTFGLAVMLVVCAFLAVAVLRRRGTA